MIINSVLCFKQNEFFLSLSVVSTLCCHLLMVCRLSHSHAGPVNFDSLSLIYIHSRWTQNKSDHARRCKEPLKPHTLKFHAFRQPQKSWEQTALQPKLTQLKKIIISTLGLWGFTGQTGVWPFFPSILKCFDITSGMEGSGSGCVLDLKLMLFLSMVLREWPDGLHESSSASAASQCDSEQTGLSSKKIRTISWNWSLEYSLYFWINWIW